MSVVFGFPLSQRSTEVAPVELYAVLIQYSEDGAAAVKATDGPDVVDGVTAVIHGDDDALALLLGLGSLGLRAHGEVALEGLHVGRGFAERHGFLGQGTEHLHHVGNRRLRE